MFRFFEVLNDWYVIAVLRKNVGDMSRLSLLLRLFKSLAECLSSAASAHSPGACRMVCRDWNLRKGRLVFPALWLPSKHTQSCRWHLLLVALWLQDHPGWNLPSGPYLVFVQVILFSDPKVQPVSQSPCTRKRSPFSHWVWAVLVLALRIAGFGEAMRGHCRPAICLWVFTEGNGSVHKITGKHMGILWGLEGMWFRVKCKPSISACWIEFNKEEKIRRWETLSGDEIQAKMSL